MVRIPLGAKGQPGIEGFPQVQGQMVSLHKGLQILGTQMLFLLAVSVGKVKIVQTKLVGHDHHPVIRHPPGDPVVAADGLQPPDFPAVGKGHAVGFAGAVLLQQLPGAQHPLPGGMDVRQHQGHQVLFPDAAGNILGAPALFGPVFHVSVRPQHPGVGGNGLRGGHGHIGPVDAAGGPKAVGLRHIGAVRIPQRIPGQGNSQMGADGFVAPRLPPGGMGQHTLRFKAAVVIAGNHGRTVMTGVSSHQNRCTRHGHSPFSMFRVNSEPRPGKPVTQSYDTRASLGGSWLAWASLMRAAGKREMLHKQRAQWCCACRGGY